MIDVSRPRSLLPSLIYLCQSYAVELSILHYQQMLNFDDGAGLRKPERMQDLLLCHSVMMMMMMMMVMMVVVVVVMTMIMMTEHVNRQAK